MSRLEDRPLINLGAKMVEGFLSQADRTGKSQETLIKTIARIPEIEKKIAELDSRLSKLEFRKKKSKRKGKT